MSKRSSGITHVVVKVLDGIGSLVRREDTDENLGEGQVGSRAHCADADEEAACLGGLLSENFSQLFFEQAVHFV